MEHTGSIKPITMRVAHRLLRLKPQTVPHIHNWRLQHRLSRQRGRNVHISQSIHNNGIPRHGNPAHEARPPGIDSGTHGRYWAGLDRHRYGTEVHQSCVWLVQDGDVGVGFASIPRVCKAGVLLRDANNTGAPKEVAGQDGGALSYAIQDSCDVAGRGVFEEGFVGGAVGR